jgi:hypothetical protein
MMLFTAFCQVKFKNVVGSIAEQALWPIGLPHDLSQHFPYLVLLLELRDEFAIGSIKVMILKPVAEGEFQKLTENWLNTAKSLEEYQNMEPGKMQSCSKVKSGKRKAVGNGHLQLILSSISSLSSG